MYFTISHAHAKLRSTCMHGDTLIRSFLTRYVTTRHLPCLQSLPVHPDVHVHVPGAVHTPPLQPPGQTAL